MPNRREFLRGAATAAGGIAGLAGARLSVMSPIVERMRDRRGPQPDPFRGARAGEQRVVDDIALCWCPPGQFVMGSPPGETGRRSNEAQAAVTLTKGFWTAKTEVTQGQWKRVIGAFPDRLPSAEFGVGDDIPVYWINFHEAESFCARMTDRAHRTGTLPRAWEFRLPTEAQWEYACRAGTTTATAFGDTLSQDEANIGYVPPTRGDPSPGRSRPVRSYPANRWGIHDMHGNVWEWCRDWYHARLPGGIDPDLYEPPGVMNRDGTHSRIRRGGAFIEPEWACRSACRLPYEPPRRSDHIGFRVLVVER